MPGAAILSSAAAPPRATRAASPWCLSGRARRAPERIDRETSPVPAEAGTGLRRPQLASRMAAAILSEKVAAVMFGVFQYCVTASWTAPEKFGVASNSIAST